MKGHFWLRYKVSLMLFFAAAVALAVGLTGGILSRASSQPFDNTVATITANCDGSGTVTFTGPGGFELCLTGGPTNANGAEPGVPCITVPVGASSPFSYQFDLTGYVGPHYRVNAEDGTNTVNPASSVSLNCGAETATPTATATNTPVSPTDTPTATPTSTNTPVTPTDTPTATETPLGQVPTDTPTATATNTPVTETNTPTATATKTNTPRATSTFTPTATHTPFTEIIPTNTPTAGVSPLIIPPTPTPAAGVSPLVIPPTGDPGTGGSSWSGVGFGLLAALGGIVLILSGFQLVKRRGE